MGLYYRIWVDSITRLRSIESNKDNWQIKSIITMSIAMTFNFLLFMAILQRNVLHCYFYKLKFPLLSEYESNIFTILILFLLPCVVANYLLIFRGKRYEKLMQKYPYHNGKLFLVYFLISLFLPIILMWVGILIYQ
jgi:hypothetical protein